MVRGSTAVLDRGRHFTPLIALPAGGRGTYGHALVARDDAPRPDCRHPRGTVVGSNVVKPGAALPGGPHRHDSPRPVNTQALRRPNRGKLEPSHQFGSRLAGPRRQRPTSRNRISAIAPPNPRTTTATITQSPPQSTPVVSGVPYRWKRDRSRAQLGHRRRGASKGR